MLGPSTLTSLRVDRLGKRARNNAPPGRSSAADDLASLARRPRY